MKKYLVELVEKEISECQGAILILNKKIGFLKRMKGPTKSSEKIRDDYKKRLRAARIILKRLNTWNIVWHA